MKQVDVIFITANRLEFTKLSLDSLLKGTNWNIVRRLIIYIDESVDVDGTAEYLRSFSGSQIQLVEGKFGNPVAVTNRYLLDSFTDPSHPPLFAKIDNDVIVPPNWLDRCLEVMNANPELDLLGIEPPASRKPAPWRNGPALIHPEELSAVDPGYVPCSSIGGIGLFRRDCFFRTGHPALVADGTYGGFTGWQLCQTQTQLRRGWILPPLSVFLLDRMPMDPYKSLSLEYIKQGWQRPWRDYTLDDHALWDWWLNAQTGQSQTAY